MNNFVTTEKALTVPNFKTNIGYKAIEDMEQQEKTGELIRFSLEY